RVGAGAWRAATGRARWLLAGGVPHQPAADPVGPGGDDVHRPDVPADAVDRRRELAQEPRTPRLHLDAQGHAVLGARGGLRGHGAPPGRRVRRGRSIAAGGYPRRACPPPRTSVPRTAKSLRATASACSSTPTASPT